MKLVILDAKTLGADLDLSVFERFGALHIYETTTKEQTIDRCKEADIVITNKVVIDRDVMDRCENIKLVCVAATGMNNVDLAWAAQKGIEVKNVAGYSTQSVVQHTFAMLFYLLHQLAYYDRYVQNGAWADSGIFTCIDRPFYEIAGKRWGIIGLGEIGKAVADVARSFGADVCYYSTSQTHDEEGYDRVSFDRLLTQSDIVSIHAPLNEKTKDLLDEAALAKLQEGAILLNLGRGGIIDEEALARLMQTKEIYVGLDVTEKEPLPKSSPLYGLMQSGRLLVTPHIAWTSIEARRKLIEGIVHNIEVFLKRHTI